MPRTARTTRWAALAALAGLTAGCGPPPTGTVTGTVSVGGQPVPNGLITFSSEVGNRDSHSAAVLNGKYTTGPIPAGMTKVTVVNRQANPAEAAAPAAPAAPAVKGGIGAGLGSGDLAPPAARKVAKKEVTVPPRYAAVESSGLTYGVVAGEQKKDFDLAP